MMRTSSDLLTGSLAVIGMACEFPDAHSPEELWQNILAGRRAFRALPDERLPRGEYFDSDPSAPGKTYLDQMAVLSGWCFDPLEFRIPPKTVEASDIAHWLALFVARAALRDAKLELPNLDRTRFGVILGNTLTGEFSRSHNLEFRWPYVEKSIRRALEAQGASPTTIDPLVGSIRAAYHEPLPGISDDSLAGNMSNTIAGRICNYFDLGGGGYAIDGACSSSLIAVIHGCNALLNHELDYVLTGGVDVSLDPFEVVGFAKTRALAKDDIRPYDERANGMITGEGCGLFVLAREEDARARGYRIHAVIRGWGYSSDGGGTGITAPLVEGQLRAIQRTYQRAGYPIASVGLIEGHGTGTPLGDKVEIAALQRALEEAEGGRRIALGSIKGNIGHTKAAAGAAGLVKVVMALKRKILPPTLNCERPNPILGSPLSILQPISDARPWDVTGDLPRRASVSSMGFGGSNSHVTIEEANPGDLPLQEDLSLLTSSQGSELVVLSAESTSALKLRIDDLLAIARRISRAELTDLAATLARETPESHRLAVVATSPWQLAAALEQAATKLQQGSALPEIRDSSSRTYAGTAREAPKWVALFPGQGSQRVNMGVGLFRREPQIRSLYEEAARRTRSLLDSDLLTLIFRDSYGAAEDTRAKWEAELTETGVAQPALVLTSIAMLSFLRELGLEPSGAIGHSLGEISALHAAGAVDATTAVHMAALRGRAMRDLDLADPGAMVAVTASVERVESLLRELDTELTISNFNAPKQIVVSGPAAAIMSFQDACSQVDLRAKRLPVSHAFHSSIVAPAAQSFSKALGQIAFADLGQAAVYSTATGARLDVGTDLRDSLGEQIERPVRFLQAVNTAFEEQEPDLWVEVGPGGVLSSLVRQTLSEHAPTCVSTQNSDLDEFDALNTTLAQAYVLGFPVKIERLFKHRFTKPFSIDSYDPQLIVNPCERKVSLPMVSGRRDFEAASFATGHNVLASAAGLSSDGLGDYLARRGNFLAAVIRADVEHGGELGSVVSSAAPHRVEPSNSETSEQSIGQLLVALVSARTGFPTDSISLDQRLLDDLNLDSIKAADIVAQAAEQLAIPGELDPAGLAGATLGELAAALRAALPSGQRPPPSEVSDSSVRELLFELISERTGFPKETLSAEQRLGDDLNLDSIKSADIVAQATEKLGITGELDPARLADATIGGVAVALMDAARDREGADGERSRRLISDSGVRPSRAASEWIRDFVVDHVEEDVPSPDNSSDIWANARLLILTEPDQREVAEVLEWTVSQLGGEVQIRGYDNGSVDGVAVDTVIALLSPAPSDAVEFGDRLSRTAQELTTVCSVPLAWQSAVRTPAIALVTFADGRFGTALSGSSDTPSAKGFAASLFLERPGSRIRVLDFSLPQDSTFVAERILREMQTADGFAAAGYDASRTRCRPMVRLCEPSLWPVRRLDLNEADVLLVTGGGKGITAECALALAQTFGTKCVLLGRTPLDDWSASAEIRSTLDRFRELGSEARYYACDVTDAEAVCRVVENAERELGTITGILHGSGANRPRVASDVSASDAISEIAPKNIGFESLRSALDGRDLKIVIGLTSVIGVAGMRGNAWYAYSNELLALQLRQYSEAHPDTAVQALAYSVWGQVGMGARLGATTALARDGVGIIDPAVGVRHFIRLLRNDPGALEVVVTGSLGYGTETWPRQGYRAVSPRRYLEELVRYEPGVEAVAGATLSLERDPALEHHVFRGTHLFPAVFGLEAMAQAVELVAGGRDMVAVRIEEIELSRPILIDPEGETKIEVHALSEERIADGDLIVRAGIRTARSGFAKDHFSAVFRFAESGNDELTPLALAQKELSLEPKSDLYGQILFQTGPFQRLERVYSLSKDCCEFSVGEDTNSVDQSANVLGDPFARDVLLQSAQVVLSQEITLPVKIDSVWRSQASSESRPARGVLRLLSRDNGRVSLEVTATDSTGRILERLSGYVVHTLEHHPEFPTPEALAQGSRHLEAALHHAIVRACERQQFTPPAVVARQLALHGLAREERRRVEVPLVEATLSALDKHMPRDWSISWTDEGRPMLIGDGLESLDVSIAHDASICLVTTGMAPQGCDVEPVSFSGSTSWSAVLGEGSRTLVDDLVRMGEHADRASARAWTAAEALKKAVGATGDLKCESLLDGAAVFRAGALGDDKRIMTIAFQLPGMKEERVAAFVVTRERAGAALEESGACDLTSAVSSEVLSGSLEHAADGRAVFVYRFPVTFREVSTASRTVGYAHYFDWIGRLREYMGRPIHRELSAHFETDLWGMVTNSAETRIEVDARFGDVIEGRLWLAGVRGGQGSTLDFEYEWLRYKPGGEKERIATSRMGMTWVALDEEQQASVEPMPEFLQTFVEALAGGADNVNRDAGQSQSDDKPDLGPVLWEFSGGLPQQAPLLGERSFETSREDSNLVGNIYFSRYYEFQSRTISAVLPPLLHGGDGSQDLSGELVARFCRVDHVREAFPSDTIVVRVHLLSVHARGLQLYFEFFKNTSDDRSYRLAFGTYIGALEGQDEWTSLAEAPPNLLRGLHPVAVKDFAAPRAPVLIHKSTDDLPEYDAIVVGSGLGGLSSAAMLARQGYRVLVTEQHYLAGGFCTAWPRTVKRNSENLTFIFDAGIHDVWGPGLQLDALTPHSTHILGESFPELVLGGVVEWHQNTHEYVYGPIRFKVPHDFEDYLQVLQQEFPEDRDGLGRLFSDLRAGYDTLLMGKKERNLRDLVHLARMSAPEYVSTFVRNHHAIRILTAIAHYLGDDPKALSAKDLVTAYGYYLVGGFYPAGSSQAVADLLVKIISEAGGEVMLRTSVARILVEDGRAFGIETGDGSVLRARVVISNADVRRTFSQLLSSQRVPEAYARRILSLKPSCSAFEVFLGLDFEPQTASVTWVLDDERAVTINIPSQLDRTLAPPGCAAATILYMIPHADSVSWVRGMSEYSSRKARLGDELIALADTAIPGLKEHILYRQDGTPATMERYAGTSAGAIYGLEVGEWRPPVRTPVRGLFFAGAATQETPGLVQAIASGILASEAAVEELSTASALQT